MVSCINCWNADFDPNYPSLHRVVLVKDEILSMSSASGEAVEVRAVQTCFKEQGYFKLGCQIEHNCPDFVAFEDGKDAFEKAEKTERKNFKIATVRKRLSNTTNLLVLLTEMSEGNDPAFDILTDAMGELGEHGSYELIVHLDDMNIRGEQIPVAMEHCGSIEVLNEAARTRSTVLIGYVNEHFDLSDTEQAVPRGANRYGHRKPEGDRVAKLQRPARRVARVRQVRMVGKRFAGKRD